MSANFEKNAVGTWNLYDAIFKPLMYIADISVELKTRKNFLVSPTGKSLLSKPMAIVFWPFTKWLHIGHCLHGDDFGWDRCCTTVYYVSLGGLRRRELVDSKGKEYPQNFSYRELKRIADQVPFIIERIFNQLRKRGNSLETAPYWKLDRLADFVEQKASPEQS